MAAIRLRTFLSVFVLTILCSIPAQANDVGEGTPKDNEPIKDGHLGFDGDGDLSFGRTGPISNPSPGKGGIKKGDEELTPEERAKVQQAQLMAYCAKHPEKCEKPLPSETKNFCKHNGIDCSDIQKILNPDPDAVELTPVFNPQRYSINIPKIGGADEVKGGAYQRAESASMAGGADSQAGAGAPVGTSGPGDDMGSGGGAESSRGMRRLNDRAGTIDRGVTGDQAAQMGRAFRSDTGMSLREAGKSAGWYGGGGKVVPDAVRSIAANREAESEKAVRRAENALREGDYNAVLQTTWFGLKNDPTNRQLWELRVEAFNRLLRFESAEEAAKHALKIFPKAAKLHAQLAWALLHLGKYEEAEAHARLAVAYDPNNPYAHAILAFAYQMLGKRGKMIEELRIAARLAPSLFGEHLRRALAGQELFNPNGDNFDLLEPLAPMPRSGPNPLLLGGLLVLAAAAGFVILLLRRRAAARDESVGRVASAELAAVAVEDKRVLAGKYKLEHPLAKGGMGEVWRARDTSLDRPVAVKKLLLDWLEHAGEDAKKAFVQEARTLANVHHPNIVDVYEIIEKDGKLHIVFEFVEGRTLADILSELKRLPFSRARELLRPVCQALDFAHSQGIIHRDLKPANIMVDGRGWVKVMDFGIAREQGTAPVPAEGGGAARPSGGSTAYTKRYVGTPGYAPPEAAYGVVSPAFDTYSLGACLYEMLTGSRPSAGNGSLPPPSSVVQGVPAGADALVAESMEPDRRKRLGAPKDFLARLNAIEG